MALIAMIAPSFTKFLARIAALPALRRAERQSPAPAISLAPLSAPLSDLMQWSRVEAVLNGGTSAAFRALSLQVSAGQQLDAAAYALEILKTEVAAVLNPVANPVSPIVVQMPRPLRSSRVRQALAA